MVTRSSKGNKSVFWSVKQTDSYMLLMCVQKHYNNIQCNSPPHFGPDFLTYQNVLCHANEPVAYSWILKLKVLEYFPLKHCFVKEKTILNERTRNSICIA